MRMSTETETVRRNYYMKNNKSSIAIKHLYEGMAPIKEIWETRCLEPEKINSITKPKRD